MPFLRQSTIQTIRFGPFLDKSDGVTEEVALTITQALRRISKDGGDFAQSGETGNSTHDEDGWYFDDLTAADTGTVGELILAVADPANHLPVWMRWWVIEEAIYDAIFGAAATGFDANQRVDLGSWLGVAPNVLISGQVDSAVGFKKNTALSNFAFLMVDSTDHVTGKTGLTFAAADFQRSIDGGAFANSTNLATEVANGVYKINLSAADLNGDVIVLKAIGTAADNRIIVIKTEA